MNFWCNTDALIIGSTEWFLCVHMHVNRQVRHFGCQVGQPMTHKFASWGHCLEKQILLIYTILLKEMIAQTLPFLCVWCCSHSYKNTVEKWPMLPFCHVPSVQQKSSGLKFSKSWTGGHVTYSCHHNSSHFTFPIFVHSWHFSVFHSLQSITPRMKIPIHLLNLKLKLKLHFVNFPRRTGS
jgi:hypothetical protein